ncbi:hypothetical protein HYH03_015557 [Edaphochlamys debaryana]|uniref:RING-type domain-containing protein n=1 Tax=Edaphochlamys debaryana TaxID=47281 RepID=A0A835XKF8_9CHLO|nr:hypothetical protein HYH03_015557 [Edaphochlamys debaryana]|eukprot:KAG2485748.1 hypothetical protein HYH03_015557 [Edaphochlamys debaryana]
MADGAVPSEVAVFACLNFFIASLAMAALVTAAVFLGPLSALESQRLTHRLVKYAVFKLVFVGSVITPDARDVAVWLAWFAVVGYLRVFLGAAKDRLDGLLTAPGAPLTRHARSLGLLVMVMVANALAYALVLHVLPRHAPAPSRVLLCAFDSLIVAIEGAKTLLRYAVHMLERHPILSPFSPAPEAPPLGPASAAEAATAEAAAGDGAWDPVAAGGAPAGAGAGAGGGAAYHGGGGGWSSKGSFLYHAELVADLLVHGATLAHYLHVWLLHGLSFHLIDAVLFLDMRAVMQSLLRRLRMHLSYCRATHRLNTAFRDVHPSQLAAERVAAAGGDGAAAAAAAAAGYGGCTTGVDCTICMDEIVHVAKQLPCGHVFHLSCLRAWLQQSGAESFTCPNCRKPILVSPPAAAGAGGPGGAGGRRRSALSDLWLVRAFDRAYVRLVVAVEPLIWTLLLRTALWLGTRTQGRRRGARSPPGAPREGSGESPWPRPSRRRSSRTRAGAAAAAAEAEAERGVFISDDDEGEGAAREEQEEEEEERAGAWGRGGVRAAAEREQEEAEEEHEELGCSSDDEGRHYYPQRRYSSDRGELQDSSDDEGAAGAGPSSAAAAAAAAGAGGRARGGRAPRARRRLLAPSSGDVPTYSGDVLPRQAAAVARQIGRTLSAAASLRTSWAAHGACAGAVAGGPEPDDDPHPEVCSRRRPGASPSSHQPPPDRTRSRSRAATAGGGGEDTAAADGAPLSPVEEEEEGGGVAGGQGDGAAEAQQGGGRTGLRSRGGARLRAGSGRA